MVVAEELPRGLLIEVELAGHDCMVGERGAFPQALIVELGTCALEADIPRGSRVAFERHRLAVNHSVLLTPAAMGFANVDLQFGIGSSPLTELLADYSKSFHVLRRTSMLRNIHAKAIVDQNVWQVGMSIQEEPVGDKQSLGIRERISRKFNYLNQLRIKSWFAAKNGDPFGRKPALPRFEVRACLIETHDSASMEVGIMRALRTIKIARMCCMELEIG